VLLAALDRVGYETPSPIQAETIPHLLAGRDLLGRAPTGTGKTAAFILPLLARLDMDVRGPQALVLTPTRELAIQVAEACRRYAGALPGFQVLPIYGGQDYRVQLRQLERGVHVVVGTPGRVMDHMRRGTLDLESLHVLVLDEADEMLRMGFIDDVEWVLEQAPAERQIALFSATLPQAIQRIAKSYLRDPVQVSIAARTATAETIRQRWWLVSGLHKLDALTRILEVEPFDALLLFVRTKTATVELAERLEARGYAAAALNGDLPQKLREQIIERLKRGQLDIIVATDVAARGLDVERISHVVNYDIPYDVEAYIHRIGRTGRAGRAGEAILFVAPRERRMLRAIEHATRQPIEPLTLPSTETVNDKRIADFKQRITDAHAAGELDFLHGLIEQYQQEHDVPATEIAAALARLVIGEQPLLLPPESERAPRRDPRERRDDWGRDRERPPPREQRPDRGERDAGDGPAASGVRATTTADRPGASSGPTRTAAGPGSSKTPARDPRASARRRTGRASATTAATTAASPSIAVPRKPRAAHPWTATCRRRTPPVTAAPPSRCGRAPTIARRKRIATTGDPAGMIDATAAAMIGVRALSAPSGLPDRIGSATATHPETATPRVSAAAIGTSTGRRVSAAWARPPTAWSASASRWATPTA
jgi:ATP-dependent RNA helicase DeaD